MNHALAVDVSSQTSACACSSGVPEMAGVLWWEDSRHWAEHYIGSRNLVSAPGSVPREPARPWSQPCQGRGVNARCKLCYSKCRDGIKHSYLQNWSQGCPSSCLFGLCLQSPQACGLEVCNLHTWGCQCLLVCSPWWLSCAPLLCTAHGFMCP